MGVDISSIVESRAISLKNLCGRIVAIDAFNSLYQFLSIIRLPDGTPLRNRDGEVTSHLSGLFYRCINFLEAGIKPLFIFDGEPPKLKEMTIQERAIIRAEAEVAWKDALAAGDLSKAWTKATRASRLTGMMVEDSMRLLELLGIPWIQAPSEGEAEASYLVLKGYAYAAASQDFDSLLFGCPRLVRNLAISGKRKLPRANRYIQVEPEEIILDASLQNLGITREQLVDIGIMIGTDYNPGLKGVGPKKALNIIKEHGSIERAIEGGIIQEIELLDDLREIYLQPEVENPPDVKWEEIDRTSIINFMCDRNSFSVDRITSALDRISKPYSKSGGTSLDQWLQ